MNPTDRITLAVSAVVAVAAGLTIGYLATDFLAHQIGYGTLRLDDVVRLAAALVCASVTAFVGARRLVDLVRRETA